MGDETSILSQIGRGVAGCPRRRGSGQATKRSDLLGSEGKAFPFEYKILYFRRKTCTADCILEDKKIFLWYNILNLWGGGNKKMPRKRPFKHQHAIDKRRFEQVFI
jgi:hypothetical protein